MIKRITAAVMSMVMILLAFGSITFAEESSAEVSESVKFLTELGIITSEIADSSQPMSREEFAVYVSKILQLPEVDASEVRYFSDVESYGYAAGAINALAEYGCISVGEDKKFRPNDSITLEEAAKILVVALGYDVMAKENGGYPGGYLVVARRLEIIGASEGAISCDKAFEMMINAMETPLFEFKSIDAEGNAIEYTKDDNVTLLTMFWDIYNVQGRVNAVYGQSLNGIYAEKNQLLLGDTVYDLNEGVEADDLLGDYVDVYYRVDKAEHKANVIMSIKRDSSKGNITIAPEDVQSVNAAELVYTDGKGNKKSVRLEAPAFVYNGSPLVSEVSATLKNINKGDIVIKDGNDDGVYDVVIVRDYANFLISSINNGMIYDKLGTSAIDLNSFDNVRIYSEAGKLAEVKDLLVGQILSVAKSSDMRSVEIRISNSELSDTVTQSRVADNVYYLTVAGQEYPVEKSYAKKVEDLYLKNRNGGESYTFKLDCFGSIAYMEKTSSVMNTGYLIEGILESGSFEKAAKLQVFTGKSEFEYFELADRVKVNNDTYKTAEEAYKALCGNNGRLSAQLVRYMADEDKKINSIMTASYDAWEKNAGFRQIHEADEVHYYNSMRMGPGITITTATEVYLIPQGVENPKEEECLKTNYSVLLNDEQYKSNGFIYNRDGVMADALVCYYTPDQIYNNMEWYSPIVMVSRVEQRYNDEEIQNCLIGFFRGAAVEYNLPESIDVSGIEEGDIVLLDNWNIVGEAQGDKQIKIVCKASDIYKNYKPGWTANEYHDYLYSASQNPIDNYYLASLQISYGFVTNVNGTGVAWDRDGDTKFDETANISGNIAIYDSSRRKGSRVYLGKATDLITYSAAGKDCSKILFRTRTRAPWDTFVYQ